MTMPQSRPHILYSIKKTIRDHDIQFVRFEQADLHGVSRSKTVPVGCFTDYVENGLNFYGGLLGLDIQSMVPTGTGYAEEVAFAEADAAIRGHLVKCARRDAQVAWLRALVSRPVVVAA
jgi:glutamine synthetase